MGLLFLLQGHVETLDSTSAASELTVERARRELQQSPDSRGATTHSVAMPNKVLAPKPKASLLASRAAGTTPNAASSPLQAAPAGKVPAPPRDTAAATSAAMDDTELEAYIERIERERTTTPPTSSTAKAQTDHAHVSGTTDRLNTNYAGMPAFSSPGATPPPLTPGKLNGKAAGMPAFVSPGATPPPLTPGQLNTKYAGMPAFVSPGTTPPPMTPASLNTVDGAMPSFVSPDTSSPARTPFNTTPDSASRNAYSTPPGRVLDILPSLWSLRLSSVPSRFTCCRWLWRPRISRKSLIATGHGRGSSAVSHPTSGQGVADSHYFVAGESFAMQWCRRRYIDEIFDCGFRIGHYIMIHGDSYVGRTRTWRGRGKRRRPAGPERSEDSSQRGRGRTGRGGGGPPWRPRTGADGCGRVSARHNDSCTPTSYFESRRARARAVCGG